MQDVRLQDLRLQQVPVVMRATMNWNPAYSRAQIPAAELARAPSHWHALARPVPPDAGRTRVGGVSIDRLSARGATVAFEVDADAQAPLTDFRFTDLDIAASRGGQIQDVLGWRFANSRLQLGTPIALGAGQALAGLSTEHWFIDPALRRRDVSGLCTAQQDVL